MYEPYLNPGLYVAYQVLVRPAYSSIHSSFPNTSSFFTDESIEPPLAYLPSIVEHTLSLCRPFLYHFQVLRRTCAQPKGYDSNLRCSTLPLLTEQQIIRLRSHLALLCCSFALPPFLPEFERGIPLREAWKRGIACRKSSAASGSLVYFDVSGGAQRPGAFTGEERSGILRGDRPCSARVR